MTPITILMKIESTSSEALVQCELVGSCCLPSAVAALGVIGTVAVVVPAATKRFLLRVDEYGYVLAQFRQSISTIAAHDELSRCENICGGHLVPCAP